MIYNAIIIMASYIPSHVKLKGLNRHQIKDKYIILNLKACLDETFAPNRTRIRTESTVLFRIKSYTEQTTPPKEQIRDNFYSEIKPSS